MSRRTEQASIVVTTYGVETAYTEQCLERIAAFKGAGPEVIVVVHDPSPMLGAYLESCRERGLVDKLVYAETGHGHLRGVNLGMSKSSRPVLLNVNIDVEISLYLLDYCVEMLLQNPVVGLIGWHYHWGAFHRGTRWNGKELEYSIRHEDDLSRTPGELDEEVLSNIQRAWWYTGRTFAASGIDRLLLCNTSFFAIRRAVWLHIGGFDWRTHPHMWADDFLCYALLEQGYDIENLPAELAGERCPALFNCHSDLKWRNAEDELRNRDQLRMTGPRIRSEKRGESPGTVPTSYETDTTMSALDRYPRPVFIIAPSTRCGTNHLKDMLDQHSHVAVPQAPLYEDFFLLDSALLEQYAVSARSRFVEFWPEAGAENYDDEILGALGRGLLSLLYADVPPGRRVLAKTPCADGLELFRRLFPDADLIFVVRDGRAVVASMMKAFNCGRDYGIRLWRDGVRKILEYRQDPASSSLLLKYEEIVLEEAASVRRILEYCGLDPEIYPYESLEGLPVLGSSVYRGGADAVQWKPVAKGGDFNPLDRFSDWGREDLRHFDKLAGAELRALGYDA